MNRPIKEQWTPYMVNQQVGGYYTVYDAFTFATVRNAGHMVPQFQPERALRKLNVVFVTNWFRHVQQILVQGSFVINKVFFCKQSSYNFETNKEAKLQCNQNWQKPRGRVAIALDKFDRRSFKFSFCF